MKLDPIAASKGFGIREIGVLDGPPLRSFETIVELAKSSFAAPMSAFFVFDDASGTIRLRSSRGLREASRPIAELPIAHSLSSEVRKQNHTIQIVDVERMATVPPEHLHLGVTSFLGSPVFGPAGETVGVLAAMFDRRHYWAGTELAQQEKLAQLLTQQILLRACLETLRLLAKERRKARP